MKKSEQYLFFNIGNHTRLPIYVGNLKYQVRGSKITMTRGKSERVMNTRIIQILKGLATHVPGLYNAVSGSTGGTNSARYCYSVWLRHLVMAYENGLSTEYDTIAELGPGDSVGIGLSALISGVEKYYALDVVEYADEKRNIKIFDELVELFEKRSRIPDNSEFPNIKPYLKSYDFPSNILTDKKIEQALKQNRIDSIRNSLLHLNNPKENHSHIIYFVPWYSKKVIKEESVDVVFSQAVLEHIDDLEFTYQVMYRWLKPGGFMSHQIDFKCHGTSKKWNGHWAYSDLVWRLIRGRRPFLINRQPHSTHIELLRKENFNIICDVKITDTAGIQRKSLAARFKNMADEDLITCGVFIQAKKESGSILN